MDANTPVRIIMNWDITPHREQEYFDFVVREFIPGVKRIGLELNDAWATVYGDRPQILVTARVDNLPKARALLLRNEWTRLLDQLLELVTDFDLKIVEARSGFQF
jgi:hypothetical protein